MLLRFTNASFFESLCGKDLDVTASVRRCRGSFHADHLLTRYPHMSVPYATGQGILHTDQILKMKLCTKYYESLR